MNRCIKVFKEKRLFAIDDFEIQEKYVSGFVEIFKNEIKKILNNENLNSDILSHCIDALGYIIPKNSMIPTIQDRECTKAQKECFKAIKEIFKKTKDEKDEKDEKDIESISNKCIQVLGRISVDSEAQTQDIDAFNIAVNSKIQKQCIDAFKYIAENSEIEDIQEQCIKEILKIFKNEIIKILKNNNHDSYILNYCVNALVCISVNPEIKKTAEEYPKRIKKIFKDKFEEEIIKEIKDKDKETVQSKTDKDKEIVESKTVQFILSKCIKAIGFNYRKSKYFEMQKQYIYFLRCIGEDYEIKNIQKKCIEEIEYKNKEMLNNKILFYCIDALGSIGANSTIQETQKQCITKIEEIFNTEIEKRSNDKQFKSDILSHYIDALGSIGANSTIQETQKQCITKIKKIAEIEIQRMLDGIDPNSNRLPHCIDALGSIGAKSTIQETQEQCIYTLEYIFTNFQIQEIQKKQCITKIKEIAEIEIKRMLNSEDPNSNILSHCIDVLKCIDEKSEIQYIQNKIKEILENNIEILRNKYIMDILVKCTESMDNLKYLAVNSKNKETQEPFIKKIIEISKESDDQYKLLCCIYSLKDIYEKSEILYIQGKCIEGIQEILKHKNHNLVLLKTNFTLEKYVEMVLKELCVKVSTEKKQDEEQKPDYNSIEKKFPESLFDLNSNNQSNNNENQPLIQYNNDELLKKERDDTKCNNKEQPNRKSYNLLERVKKILPKKWQSNTKKDGYKILK